MKDIIHMGGEIGIEIIRKNGRREIYKHNTLTDFGRSLCLSQGLSKLKRSTNLMSTLVSTHGTNMLDNCTYAANGTTSSSIAPAVDSTSGNSKLCTLLMNIPTDTLTKKRSCFMPESANLLGYAFRESSAAAANEGLIYPLNDRTVLKNRIATRYVFPTDLAGQFNTVAMSTLSPVANYGRCSKVGHSITRLRTSYSGPTSCLYDGTYLYLPNDAGKVNIADGSVDTHSYTNFMSIANTGVLFSYNGIPAMFSFYYYGSTSNIYRLDLTTLNPQTGALNTYYFSFATSWAGSYYHFSGAFFKNGSLYVTCANYKYKLSIDTTNGQVTYDTTTDDLTDELDKLCLPLSETEHIKFDSARSSSSSLLGDVYFNNVKVSINPVVFLNDSKLLTLKTGDYGTQGAVGYGGEYLLTELGNIISYHTYQNPIIKNAGDQLSITYSYFCQ